MDPLVRDLSAVLRPDQVLGRASARRAYDCDAYMVERNQPGAVVLPESTAEVAAIVRHCVAHGIPYTARGAGTGLSGGVLPALGGVVVSTKRMDAILEVDLPNRCLLAQSGIVNAKITDAVRPHGLHFAPDPSSQTVSTLGGNIGENAGGPHTLKYGVTVQHILGVTLVEPGGEVIRLGGKLGGGPGFDLLSLVVGGEGTTGIVTEAWVRLTPLPTAVITALASFSSVRHATQAVADIIASGAVPAALEMMDKGILHALRAAFGLSYPDGTEALLLVECDNGGGSGGDEAQVAREMAAVRSVCEANGSIAFETAQDEKARQRLWVARKKGVGALGRIAPTVVTHDGVIPRSRLPEMLEFVDEVGRRHGLRVANIFHAGDGNLHPIFCFDEREPGKVEAVVAAGEEIMRRCVELGGSLTGEHGIGVEKAGLMSLMFNEADLAAQALAKRVFNDGDLCNPCKVLPSQKSCTEHRSRWRGAAW